MRRSLGQILAAQSTTGRENTVPMTDKRPSSLLIQMQGLGRDPALAMAGTCKTGRTRNSWVERQNGLPCHKNPNGHVALEGTWEGEAGSLTSDRAGSSHPRGRASVV